MANISSVLGDIFRFMYGALLHCCCCICRAYSRHRRRQKRRIHAGKITNPRHINYTGTETLDPSWPEANRPSEGKLNDEEYDDDDDDEEDDIWDRIESRVPFGAIILIIIGYICLGALMFSKFEDWSMIISVYFCYITLATIGFGDYVCKNLFFF